MKTKFWVSYNYGAWQLRFTKTVDLPFAPFFGLMIMDDKTNFENIIELVNHGYCRTTIMYDLQDNEFDVDVHILWMQPVKDDVIDNVIEKFTKTGWERDDSENLKQFKKLMRDNYEKQLNKPFS